MPKRAINIHFACDNAAFDGDPEVEIARILRTLAEKVEADPRNLTNASVLRDLNGNSVGHFEATGFDDDDDDGAASEARQQHRMSYGRDPELD